MALNTSHANGGVLLYNGEIILVYYDGVEMSFVMESHMPHFKGTKKGRAYLTTHRVIFNSTNTKDTLQSFSMPFHCMREVELEQPVFGANYIKGKVRAEIGGNFDGNGKWKMWFNHGGAIEFGTTMLTAGKLASRHAARQPPPYTPPAGPYYQAPPPAYTMPHSQTYSFVPVDTFPTAPPTNQVYMTDAPPPYAGVDPNMPTYSPPAYQPQQANVNQSAADAKAAEAAAYYNPATPNNVYMPQPMDAPPTYDAATKKAQ